MLFNFKVGLPDTYLHGRTDNITIFQIHYVSTI